MTVGLAPLRVLLPPFINPRLGRRAAIPLTPITMNYVPRCPGYLQMLFLFAPVPLIDRHSQAGELRYIVPGECHIVLVEHLKGAHHIIFCKAVYILHAHIIVGPEQRESVPAQLVLVYPAFFRINRQRHNAIETMTHPDFIGDPVQPPVVKVTLDRPAAPPLLLDDPPLIPIRVLLLCLGQRQAALSHKPLKPLLLPVAVRNIIKQPRQLHRPAKPERPHRVLTPQLRAGADHPKALQNPLHLRLLDGRGKLIPNLPGEGIFQLFQAFLVMRVHRHRLFQHIIQVKPCPAVYNKGCLGQNILVHLVQRVPKLGHTHPVQVKNQGIEIPGIFAAPPPPKIGDRGHNREIGILQLPQLVQFVSDGTAFRFTVPLDLQGNPRCLVNLTFRHRHRNSVSLPVLKMALSLERSFREDLSIKLIRIHWLQKLL